MGKSQRNFFDDIKRKYQVNRDCVISENTQNLIENECLLLINDLLVNMTGKSLSNYGLPKASINCPRDINNEYFRATNFNFEDMSNMILTNEPLLNIDQKTVYEQILSSINTKAGKLFFLDAPGGTGKTFLINLLLAKVRSEQKIALAVASSGIAATLLEGGCTAHSMFKLPFNLIGSDTLSCNISKQSDMAAVIKKVDFVVWDESTMTHKVGIEAVDRLFRDIRDDNRPGGGITILFSGDFRQTLPVVPKGTKGAEIKACLKKSYLWKYIEVVTLNINMRVHLMKKSDAIQFSDLLLKLGN